MKKQQRKNDERVGFPNIRNLTRMESKLFIVKASEESLSLASPIDN